MESVRVEEGRGGKPGRHCNYWCAAGIAFLFGIVGVVAVFCLYLPAPKYARSGILQYGIVVDAGSTHSELSLFRWAGDKLKGTGEVIQLTDCEGDGPISSYGDKDTPEGAGQALQKCLKEAKYKIPKDRHEITPIYLGATAGMRILQGSRPAMAEAVFDSVRQAFGNTSFKITPDNVRIVADEEEGLYAWIAANLIKGTLGQTGEQVATTGTLDMGGASTQIAFQTSEKTTTAKPSNYVDLKLYGFDFTIFTHSYLCFGQKELIRRAKAQLILDQQSLTIKHPCLHSGHTVKQAAKDFFEKPCTVPFTKVGFSAKPEDLVEFQGTGNPKQCEDLIGKLVDPVACHQTKYQHCFDHDLLPKTKGEFIAISTFYFTAKYIDADKTDMTTYRKNAEAYCSKDWGTVQSDGAKDKLSDDFLSSYCIASLFTLKVIGEIYGLGGDRWKDVKFIKKIDGVSMGWSLGFMTNATNSIPSEKVTVEREGMPSDFFITLLVLFMVLVIIVLVLSYRAWTQRRGRNLNNEYDDNACLALCCPKK